MPFRLQAIRLRVITPTMAHIPCTIAQGVTLVWVVGELSTLVGLGEV